MKREENSDSGIDTAPSDC